MAQIKRCKSCRLWRPERAQGTPARNKSVCWLRLREMTQPDGEKVLRPTLQMHDSDPGKYYRKPTGPNFVCGYYVPKHMPILTEKAYEPARLPEDAQQLISVDDVAELGKDVSENETHTDGDHVRRRDQVCDGSVAQ